MRELPEYSNDDPHKRLAYFYELYQLTGASIMVPDPYEADDGEVAGDEYWLQSAAYHAGIALLDALAGLVDILNDKVLEGTGDGEE